MSEGKQEAREKWNNPALQKIADERDARFRRDDVYAKVLSSLETERIEWEHIESADQAFNRAKEIVSKLRDEEGLAARHVESKYQAFSDWYANRAPVSSPDWKLPVSQIASQANQPQGKAQPESGEMGQHDSYEKDLPMMASRLAHTLGKQFTTITPIPYSEIEKLILGNLKGAYIFGRSNPVSAEENHREVVEAFQRGQQAMAEQASQQLQPLKDVLDRDWKDETPQQIIAIAANAIYWRTRGAIKQVVAICEKYPGIDGMDGLIDEIEELAPYPSSPNAPMKPMKPVPVEPPRAAQQYPALAQQIIRLFQTSNPVGVEDVMALLEGMQEPVIEPPQGAGGAK